jgi:hypothetical protein
MLLRVGLIVLVATPAIRLRWRTIPGVFTTIGVLLGAHLIAVDVVPPDRRPPVVITTVFLTGIFLMFLVMLLAGWALRRTRPTEPPR